MSAIDLKQVKKGDKLWVRSHFGPRHGFSPMIVKSVTPKGMFNLVNEANPEGDSIRFGADGRERGRANDYWSRASVDVGMTYEDRAAHIQKLDRKLDQTANAVSAITNIRFQGRLDKYSSAAVMLEALSTLESQLVNARKLVEEIE